MHAAVHGLLLQRRPRRRPPPGGPGMPCGRLATAASHVSLGLAVLAVTLRLAAADWPNGATR